MHRKYHRQPCFPGTSPQTTAVSAPRVHFARLRPSGRGSLPREASDGDRLHSTRGRQGRAFAVGTREFLREHFLSPPTKGNRPTSLSRFGPRARHSGENRTPSLPVASNPWQFL